MSPVLLCGIPFSSLSSCQLWWQILPHSVWSQQPLCILTPINSYQVQTHMKHLLGSSNDRVRHRLLQFAGDYLFPIFLMHISASSDGVTSNYHINNNIPKYAQLAHFQRKNGAMCTHIRMCLRFTAEICCWQPQKCYCKWAVEPHLHDSPTLGSFAAFFEVFKSACRTVHSYNQYSSICKGIALNVGMWFNLCVTVVWVPIFRFGSVSADLLH